MADEIEIVNVGGPGGVAADVTLQNLIDEVKKLGAGSGSVTMDRRLQELYRKHLKDGGKSLADLKTTTAKANEQVSALGKVAQKTGTLFGETLGMATGVISNFANEVKNSSTRISDFAQHIPLVGGLLGSLTGILDDQMETFRSMSNVGAVFSGDMLNASRASTEAAMSLDMFATFVSNNSESLKSLGGTVDAGVARFARLSREIRESEFGTNLFGLGYSIEMINEGILAYTDNQARAGRLQNLTDLQLRQGTQTYLNELEKLTRLTGLSREEAARQLNQQQEDVRNRAYLNSLAPEERARAEANLAIMQQLGPTFYSAAQDLMDGVTQTEEGAAFETMMGEAGQRFVQLSRNMANMSQEELYRALAEIGPGLQQEITQFGPEVLQAFMDEGGIYGAFARVGNELSGITRLNPESIEELMAAFDRSSRLNQLFGSFGQAVQTLRSRIIDGFLNSRLFVRLQSLFEQLATNFDGISESQITAVFDMLAEKGESLITWIGEFFGENGMGGRLWTAVGNWIEGIGTDLGEGRPISEIVIEQFGNLGGLMRTAFEALFGTADSTGMLQDLYTNVKTWLFGGGEEGGTGVATQLYEDVKSFLFGAEGSGGGVADQLFNSAKSWMFGNGEGGGIAGRAEELFTSTKEWLFGSGEGGTGVVDRLWASTREWLFGANGDGGIAGQAITALENFYNSDFVQNKIVTVFDNLYTHATAWIDRLINYVMTEVPNLVRGLVGQATSGAAGGSLSESDTAALAGRDLSSLSLEERQDLIQTARERNRQRILESEGGDSFFNRAGAFLGNASDLASDAFGNLDARTMSDESFLSLMREAGIEGFNTGTRGFRDFGKGQLAILHGEEAVVPKDSPEGKALQSSMSGSQDSTVSALNMLNSNINRLIEAVNQGTRVSTRQLSVLEEAYEM